MTDDETRSKKATADGKRPPLVPPGVASSALWGVTGGLSFLVLVQGYELLTGQGVSLAVKFGVALVVGVVAGVSTHVARRRVPVENESA